MPESLTAEVVDQYPLSPLQHGMLFHHVQNGPSTGVDLEQLDGLLHEPIQLDSFRAAWQTVAELHPVLRTRFRWDEGEARQEVLRQIVAPIDLRDLTSSSPAEQATLVREFLAFDRTKGFDLSDAPLWRVTLFRLGEASYRIIWTYSHAILDASFGDVLRDVFDTYARLEGGGTANLAPRPSFRDHIVRLQSDRLERADAITRFWRDRLDGFITPTNLEWLQTAGTAESGPAGHDTHHFRLTRATSDQIHQACADHQLRPSTFVDAAWALVLGAFSGEDDVVFGTTRSCRRSSDPATQGIVGLLINTVPMRVRLTWDAPAVEFLKAIRRDQQSVRPFENTPLVDVRACSVVPRGASLFDTIIVFNDSENDARLKSFGPEWKTREFELHDQTNFPMNVMAYDGPELSFKLSFDRRRFGRPAVERIAGLFQALLVSLGADLAAPLRRLPRQPADDRPEIAAFNATVTPISEPSCVHEAFEAQVDRTPAATAVVFRGQSVTYRELDERANRIAHELTQLGVGPDQMVGIFVERSVEMVVGLLAVLKAGAAYVPMDPAYPSERIAWMLEDTDAPVVLTSARLRQSLPPTRARVLALDAFGSERSPRRPDHRANGSNLAYVIFTSGSTGRPKGVQIEHRNVANFFTAMDLTLGPAAGVWLALTSISFDISVLEIFWTLARGFTVVVQEEAEGAKRAAAVKAAMRPIGFSLFYFAADAGDTGNRYRLLIEGAKFADTHDFEAVWTPERHFHAFGGLYPNPSVTSAAIAMVTTRIGIRAGSVVLPLHNPIRCAEEWSVVDNLSNGRVGLSFASGWHSADFALAPANFKDRRELMARGIETVRALWRGDSVPATAGDGKEIQVRMYPPSVQRAPSIWITASGSPDTFAMAGRTGANILTNLLVMKPEELVANAAVYRRAYREAGHAGDGHITLMLHTFVGETMEEVRAKVREPFLEYLRTSTDLINKARWELTAFAKAGDGAPTGRATMDLAELSDEDMSAILDHAFERYFATAGLFGTPDSCIAMVDRLRELGVDEIACLIDFGVDTDSVLKNLAHLDELRRRTALDAAGAPVSDDEDYTIAAQVRRHRVTHLQCTPSLLGALLLDGDAAQAIGALDMLLVGGEPLPPALIERMRPSYPKSVRNMYGPTETTIWSTTSPIEPGDRVTIGKPIANTTIHIVDRQHRELPRGVPGELLIGGAGVVRGYLGRPELTAQRFVPLPQGDSTTRAYRTGDLARWLPSGDIEFSGRLDHQIKIRGYRIELGEIESVLGEDPAVQEAVVVAREGGAGDARLCAYIVPRKATEARSANVAAKWEAIWDETYKDTESRAAGTNVSGWNSSYTGLPLPQDEVLAWADTAAERLLASAPERAEGIRVLEIGCGTGLLLFRVAPRVHEYVGIDFSATALAYIKAQLSSRGLTNVALERLAADDLNQLSAAGTFDVVIINSVAQYFPDASYLERVLRAAYARLSPGGALFVGDVRSRRHLDAFHAAIEMARSDRSAPVADLQERIRSRGAEEAELVLDPEFFESVARDLPDAMVERAELKPGVADNEMTAFRYDVVVRRGAADRPRAIDATPTVSCPSPASRASLEALLQAQPAAIRVEGIANARVMRDVAAARLLAENAGGASVADMLNALDALPPGLSPEEVRTLDPRYDAVLEFSRERPEMLDATFSLRGHGVPAARPSSPALAAAARYANVPAQRDTADATLIPELRRHLRTKLPEYMVPATFMLLDALPLTPNGKIDRAALPLPERKRVDAVVREKPQSDLERSIAEVLQELLGVDEVGVDDNFFDVGANSLMMVQAAVQLRSVLGRPVPLIRMFQHPTARALAAALGSVPPAADQQAKQSEAAKLSQAAKPSQDRAQMRREALQRMRGTTRSRQ